MIDTATEQEIDTITAAHISSGDWVEASKQWADCMSEDDMLDMCRFSGNWGNGEQYGFYNNTLYCNPRACAMANLAMLRKYHSSCEDKLTALYRHYGDAGELLYVGISVNPIRRMQEHDKSAWWDEITTIEIERFPTRKEALLAETTAILEEKPIYNVHQNVAE